MTVKYLVTAAEYAALSADLKAEYDGDDASGYKLDLTGLDTKAADNLTAERGKRRAAEKRATEAEKKLEEFQDGDDRPALIEKHTRELTKERQATEAANQRYSAYATKQTVNSDVTALAHKLAGDNATIMAPHIRARLAVDLTDPDNPRTVVLDDKGQASTKTLDDLHKEFVANKAFSAIIKATPASGGLATSRQQSPRSGNPAGAPPTPPQHAHNGAPGQYREPSPSELARSITERRAQAGMPVLSSDQ